MSTDTTSTHGAGAAAGSCRLSAWASASIYLIIGIAQHNWGFGIGGLVVMRRLGRSSRSAR